MADMNEKSACSSSHDSGKQRGSFSHRWRNLGALTPAYVYTQEKSPHELPSPSSSLWERWSAWFRYYSIQWRWDIERKLARLLHRSWV